MKKNIAIATTVLALVLCLAATSLFVASAGSESDVTDATLEIVSNNVSYADSIYILYAVANTGFDRTEHEIKMLFWNEAQDIYALGTENYSTTNSGTAKVKGKSCLVFYSEGLAAKEMTDDVYARACVVIDGKEYYSDVMKFSVLEYVHTMREQGNIGNGQIKLFTTMLEYGTAAQNNFGHNTDRPANGDYHKITVSGGRFGDGFDSGRYLAGDEVVITPNEPEQGMRFSHWIDENGIIVSFDKELLITVGEKAKEYTAVYKDISNVVAQLMLKSEIPYNGTVDDIDLPTAVTFEINGESVTLDVTWDTGDFETSKIGKQNILATLVDSSAYAEYGIEPGSIVLEVNTLPYAYELDTSNGEYVITGYYGDDESITLPSTYRYIYISRIATRAFNRAMTLKEVIVPDTVKQIDNGAFFYCDNIERMTVPFIGESEGSSNSWFGWIFGAAQYDVQHGMLPLEFNSITLSDGAIRVPSYAFYNCSQITEFNIPDTVRSIYSGAFSNCTGLTEFTIPSSLVEIGGTFAGCSNLKKVNTSSIDSLFNIILYHGSYNVGPLSNGAELYCKGELVREVRIPNGVNHVYLILQGCTSIEKITVPSSVKTFGWYAFSGMTSLKEVVFENPALITDVAGGMFDGCTSLVEADFSEFTSLKKMSGTFSGCTSLESVKLPAGLTELGDAMFTNTAIREILLPEGIQKIPNSCFHSCSNLESIRIPDGVVEIGMSAFYNCSSLREVVMPAGLTVIRSWAFESCEKLTVIDLPERLYEIEGTAFRNCKNLAKLIIRSERLTDIGSSAFSGCSKLYEIFNLSSLNITPGSRELGEVGYYAKVVHTTLDEASQITIDENGFVFFTTDTENTIVNYVGSATDIVIPTLDNGKPTVIGDEAFRGNSQIVRVTVGAGVSRIGSHAFEWCSSLTTVIIGDSVTSIGYGAFSSCDSLTSVTIGNGVTCIGDYAFNECDSLASITIGDSVTSIGEWALFGCDSLTSVTIGNSVTSIGSNAFYSCHKLVEVINRSSMNITAGSSDYGYVGYYAIEVHTGTSKVVKSGDYLFYTYNGVNYLIGYVGNDTELVLPNNYNGEAYQIYNRAFYNCDSLTSVTIPNSVTSIGSSAFCDCDSLVSVTIGNSVTSIGSDAFYNCDSLTSVTIGNGVTSIGNYAFNYCTSLISIKYRGTEEQWEAITKYGYWDGNTSEYTIEYNYDGE